MLWTMSSDIGIKICHISDLHIRSNPDENDVLRERLQDLQDSLMDDDLVVITGDITDDGHEKQYANAYELLRPFAGRAILVPGNHDYGYRGLFYSRDCFRRFHRLRQELKAPWQHTLRHNGIPVGEILVVDSCRRTSSVVDLARGRVGWWRRRWLAARLDAMRRCNALPVIAMHHSPLCEAWYLRLDDARQVLDMCMEASAILLCGHEHARRHAVFPPHAVPGQRLSHVFSATTYRGERTDSSNVEVICL